MTKGMACRWVQRGGLMGLLSLAVAFAATAQGFHIKPHLQNITKDGATVIWEAEDPCAGAVQYLEIQPGQASVDPAGGTRVESAAPAEIHRVRISGLKPDTSYAYVASVPGASLKGEFRTAPEGNVPATFIALGDSRRWEDRWTATQMAQHTFQWNPAFYINNGDLVRKGHDYELWPEHFDRFADVTNRFMMVTARGNHEGSMYSDKENDWFGKYHEMPGEGEPRFSFDWGNAHVAVISYEDVGGVEKINQSAEWLDRDLAKVEDGKWTVVVQHFPIYCAGYNSPEDERRDAGESLAPIARVMEKHGVHLDMAGHTHIYERSYPLREGKRDDSGIVYLVNGGDINSQYPDTWTAVRDDNRVQAKPTYSAIQCFDDRMEIQTFCWSTTGNQIARIDHVIIPKDESVAKTIAGELKGKQGPELLAAIERVGAMMYGPAAGEVAAYLSDASPEVRRAAASALRSIGTQEAAEALAPFLKDADVEVRRQAARALEINLPEKMRKEVKAAVLDPQQDSDVRVALLGALQLHGAEHALEDASTEILKSDAPVEVRRRAAYAMGRVAEKSDAGDLCRIVSRESDPYVLLRLGHTLNNVTGTRVSLDEDGVFARSQPGGRKEFTDRWLGR